MSWLTEHLGPNPTVDEVIGKIGALLVGNRTFRGDDPYKGTTKEGKPFGGGWTGPQFVRTHHPPDTSVPGITEILVLIAPVLLSDGVRLFDRPVGPMSSSNASA